MSELLISQLTDVFRIGLLIALVFTMQKTSAVTGRLIPLAMGVVFVAVILPSTMPGGAVPLQDAILMGLVSNSIILGLVLVVAAAVKRLRG